ncbi:PA2778 family cysteine peptidase [Aestuariicella sp. G3-2]|uniref:PA2778 family cysteine peptidase n=1 Tax=Pseudomaricurvus albidus TaxID=2842452 RepID=UPI001C0D5764|nr:PA2778 family cysteine peptidase [Aestuariicella albida]MBU3071073.1 PA2778 family cysteine peptidase [Aestuariicella albida]
MPRLSGLIGLLCGLFLVGCGSLNRSPDNLSDVVNQLQLPLQAELADVPFFSQRQEQCGPASLATVLNYRQIKVSAEQLEPLLYIPEKQGTLSIELTAQARSHGLLVYPIDKQLVPILQEVAAGNPVLVMQNLGLSWWPQWHFAVIVGYDLQTRSLLLRSGNEPRRHTPFKSFLNTWSRAERWGIVIVSADQIPASAEPTPYLKAASDLEHQHPEAARQAYVAALNQWSNIAETQRLARLGLANIAYNEQQYSIAKRWLAESPPPLSAVQWNNLGYTLSALSCPQSALQAVKCAQALQPEAQEFSQSVTELSRKSLDLSSRPNADKINGDPVCQIPPCPAQIAPSEE